MARDRRRRTDGCGDVGPSSPGCATSTASRSARSTCAASRRTTSRRTGCATGCSTGGASSAGSTSRSPTRSPAGLSEDDPTVDRGDRAARARRSTAPATRSWSAIPRPVLRAGCSANRASSGCASSPATVYLTLCYHEVLTDPTRPLLAARLRAAAGVRVRPGRRDVPDLRLHDPRPIPGRPASRAAAPAATRASSWRRSATSTPPSRFAPEQVDLAGRRRLALHDLAKITGINWVHGGDLQPRGRERPARRGPEVPLLAAGAGRHAAARRGRADRHRGRRRAVGLMYNIRASSTTCRRRSSPSGSSSGATTEETLQYGDRVMITVRGDFIARRVLPRAGRQPHRRWRCRCSGPRRTRPSTSRRDPRCPPRPSGDGTEGGDFVSWIFVRRDRK